MMGEVDRKEVLRMKTLVVLMFSVPIWHDAQNRPAAIEPVPFVAPAGVSTAEFLARSERVAPVFPF